MQCTLQQANFAFCEAAFFSDPWSPVKISIIRTDTVIYLNRQLNVIPCHTCPSGLHVASAKHHV